MSNAPEMLTADSLEIDLLAWLRTVIRAWKLLVGIIILALLVAGVYTLLLVDQEHGRPADPLECCLCGGMGIPNPPEQEAVGMEADLRRYPCVPPIQRSSPAFPDARRALGPGSASIP